MKEHFLLDPDVFFLNHGSFGATPRAVMDAYREWQTRLERQPVQFIIRELLPELKGARQTLGNYLDADADDLVYIPNTTFGVNIIARSLELKAGDQILASDHEYGACQNVWEFTAQKTGAVLVRQPVPLPLGSPEAVAEQFWGGVTPRTKVIFLSHITSPTAQRMPVEIICQRARQTGILTVIDGAHAPGQIPLSLAEIDPDFYVGNCHKWMLSPKGAGFLYTRRGLQERVEPLVVSWGWGQNSPYTSGSRYVDTLEWLGTNDPSAYLSVPAAIRFMVENDWEAVRKRCASMLNDAIQRITELTGLPSVYTDQAQPFSQMAVAALAAILDISDFQSQLYRQYRVEIPCIQWNGGNFIRLSVQGYNTTADIEALLKALAALLPQHIPAD